MPQVLCKAEVHVEDLQSDLDFARYEMDLLLREIMVRVNNEENVPLIMTHQQRALESEIDDLIERLGYNQRRASA